MIKFLPFLLLVLPTLLYIAYVVTRNNTMLAQGQEPPPPWWDQTPWFWLAVAGMVLAAGSLVAWAVSGQPLFGGEYQPTGLIDGEWQRGGYIEPSD